MPVRLLAAPECNQSAKGAGAALDEAERGQGCAEGGQGAGVEQAQGGAVGREEGYCACWGDYGFTISGGGGGCGSGRGLICG
jgi:hypothetical protein